MGHLLSGLFRYSRGHGDLGAHSSTKDRRYDAALFNTMSITEDVYADLDVSYRHRRAQHKTDLTGTEIKGDADPQEQLQPEHAPAECRSRLAPPRP